MPFPRGGVFSSNAYLQRLEVVEITPEAVEHLAHRHALDSFLVLDQDHTVGPLERARRHTLTRGIEIVEVPPIS